MAGTAAAAVGVWGAATQECKKSEKIMKDLSIFVCLFDWSPAPACVYVRTKVKSDTFTIHNLYTFQQIEVKEISQQRKEEEHQSLLPLVFLVVMFWQNGKEAKKKKKDGQTI